MSFNNPDASGEKQAKEICDLLGIVNIKPAKFRRLTLKVRSIKSDGAEQAYASLGRNLVFALGNIEQILAELRKRT